jgi:carbon storage regulator CsrA
MLVLTRKTGEQIVLPTRQLTMTVLNVSGDRVKIGISAPTSVTIHRKEVWQSIKDMKKNNSENIPMSISLLIADPNEYLLDLYREYFPQHGFRIATATNGLDCVEKLREFAPDILVLEPMMPWGGGDGVLALMHKDSDIPDVPVMILTYGCDPNVLYNISPFPISDYQKKPMSPKQLAARISKIVADQRTMVGCSTSS